MFKSIRRANDSKVNIQYIYIFIIFLHLGCKSNVSKLDDFENKGDPENFVVNQSKLIILKNDLKTLVSEMSEKEKAEYLDVPYLSNLEQFLFEPHIRLDLIETIKASINELGIHHFEDVHSIICVGVWEILTNNKGLIERKISYIKGQITSGEPAIPFLPIKDCKALTELEIMIKQIINSLDLNSQKAYKNTDLNIPETRYLLADKLLYGSFNENETISAERLLPSIEKQTKTKIYKLFSKLNVNSIYSANHILNAEMWLQIKHNKSLLKLMIMMHSDYESAKKYEIKIQETSDIIIKEKEWLLNIKTQIIIV